MAKKKPAKGKPLTKGTGVEAQARKKKTQVKLSGKTTRSKGHLSSSTRRSQSKRDSKNA